MKYSESGEHRELIMEQLRLNCTGVKDCMRYLDCTQDEATEWLKEVGVYEKLTQPAKVEVPKEVETKLVTIVKHYSAVKVAVDLDGDNNTRIEVAKIRLKKLKKEIINEAIRFYLDSNNIPKVEDL